MSRRNLGIASVTLSLAITERYLECDDDEMRAAMLGAA